MSEKRRTTEDLKRETNKLFGVNKEIEVVPNFFCPNHLSVEADEEFRLKIAPDDQPILTHISNFRPVKRVLDVVKVFNKVLETRDCRLLLVGDGPDRTASEKLCREFGIEHKVVFLGKVKNPIEPLMISDLFILPSEAESFGLAALEAMAAGVPVIATNAGGLPELVENGISGLLCDVGDIDSMASSVLKILSNEAGFRGYRSSTLERAQTFRIDSVLPKYVNIYNNVTSN